MAIPPLMPPDARLLLKARYSCRPNKACWHDWDMAISHNDHPVRLFSYGTLQDPAVQKANFGRELAGDPDSLPGYELSMVEITDPDVVAVSGAALHPIVRPTGRLEDAVEGTVFSISEAELAMADDYEVDDYTRIAVVLGSGTDAWVYVQADLVP